MEHTDVNLAILEKLQEIDGIEDASIEAVVGGIAMTLCLMMNDLDVKEIEVGPHTISISTEQE